MPIIVKSRDEIGLMREAGRILAETLEIVVSHVRPGVIERELDEIARREFKKRGVVPTFLNYGEPPYPAAICVSVNDEIVHGIPGERTIRAGSLVSVDVGAIVEGWHGDGARTFVVGDVGQQARDLVDATRLAMMAGIGAAQAGARVGDISAAVEDVGKAHGFGIVRPFVGHGIGTEMHQEPQVPNYRTGSRGPELLPGVCLAIEPMFTLGSGDVYVEADGWTVNTADDALAAHFEHTIAVTDDGPEILTTIR